MRNKMKLALSLDEEPFFAGMSGDLRARVQSFVYHRRYDTRQVVFFPNDDCAYVYWVREGRVKITRVSREHRELTFRHFFSGDIFGEECMDESIRRNDYAEALSPAVLCLMRAGDFRRFMREDAEFCFAVTARMNRRMKELEQVFAENVFNSVISRAAAMILRLYRLQGSKEDEVPLTHQELANLIGATRETTTAMLHQLRGAGAIQIANRRLTIADHILLEHFAHEE
jgi:CRP/FNR family transcriptional regulator, cyclic AMP receptor protein